jgi:hypothetical protein
MTEMNLNEFLSAGLDEEAIYRLNIKKMEVKTKIVENEESKNFGQEYKVIDGQVELVERFGGERPGVLEYPIREFLSFFLNGRHLQRFRDLYTAAFGEIPTSRPGVVTIEDLAAALVGIDTVYTTLYWRRNKKTQEVEQVLGWDFSTDPNTLKQPKPFAERDERAKAEAEAQQEAEEAIA